MTALRLVVIGGIAAGTKAAAKARRDFPDAKITVLTRDAHISVAGCAMPYFLGDIIQSAHELVVVAPETYCQTQDVAVLTRHEATAVDTQTHVVTAQNLESGENLQFPYDRLILATGAYPIRPSVIGHDLQGIYTIRDLDELIHLKEDLVQVKRVVVVGSGLIGLEVAENLHKRQIATTVLEYRDLILAGFDREMALIYGQALVEAGLDIRTGQKVIGFRGENGRVTTVQTEDGEYPADLVVWAAGVRPDVRLAVQAGVKLGVTGAIAVNDQMETSIPGVFAVGDCAETVHLVSGQHVWYPMGSTANKAGRVAGHNTGSSEAPLTFPGVLGTTILRVLEWNAGRTGLTEEQALAAGFDVVSALVPANDRPHYLPGYREILTKITVDQSTRRVLGVQVIGEGVVDKPIDIAATLISLGGTVDDMANLDLAYAPPFSPALASTIVAAHVIQNILAGRLKGISPLRLQEQLQSSSPPQVVDIRTEPEFMIRAIPGSVNIPQEELLGRLEEIDPARELILVCKAGRRAYSAARKLNGRGYNSVSILDGGITSWPFELI